MHFRPLHDRVLVRRIDADSTGRRKGQAATAYLRPNGRR
jgi:co-chaperonin GroES (HSP10)